MSVQITAEGLKGMTAEQIVKAHQDGQLSDLLQNGTPEAVAARKERERVIRAEAISDAEAMRIDGINEPAARNYHGKV